MLLHKYKKSPSGRNWDNYKKHRNAFTKLNVVLVYQKSKDLWPIIKPFLSRKGSGGGSEIILSEIDKNCLRSERMCRKYTALRLEYG